MAEGVNLPIRTLVLYSVQRLGAGGARQDLLTRDIKNLVGRAGRAGSTTKGLVICANPDQWPLVAPVARQAAGEPVVGALRTLIAEFQRQIITKNLVLTNELLENSLTAHSLVDGVDATLIDLAAVEIGEEELAGLAINLADQTFASRQANEASKQLLRDIFRLRAQRVSNLRATGRLAWIKGPGQNYEWCPLLNPASFPVAKDGIIYLMLQTQISSSPFFNGPGLNLNSGMPPGKRIALSLMWMSLQCVTHSFCISDCGCRESPL